ncbi:TetR/AcrR family transcriptional regulator [Leekyejoonella antrihumi]|uniref:TetR/AcrR family transcriptional regulator n=1 Tax=Leekyejoonella antrihumi TaxID=1660198 RepID=UPI001647A0B8|nr:TetR/AcrR family transcriptional regulator [Leekyejoonella antrihumi]
MRKILDATLEIIVEDGLPGLNTNRVAKRAGVNVATVYSYFPDKISILRQLAKEFEEKRGDYVADHARLLPTTPDWKHWFDEVIDRLVLFRLEEPGAVELRRAVMSSPDLKYLDDDSTDRAVESNLPGLMAHGRALRERQARVISRVVAVTITAMIDSAFMVDPYAEEQIGELKSMIGSYLALHLD